MAVEKTIKHYPGFRAVRMFMYLTLRLFFGVPNQIEIINAEIAIRVCPSKANIHIFYNIYIYISVL